MDSGNSGSLQSSSDGDGGVAGGGSGGGDEIYDSRTESMFLNHSTQFNIQQQQPPSTFVDTSSFLQPPNPNQNPVYNLDSLWFSNPNPNPNPIYNLDSQQDPHLNQNPVDTRPEKIDLTTKNPKKRTRASRRAPTTVLTTDATNFRQMVQEFTGIPAAPFSSSSSMSSPFSRRRDVFGGGIAPLHPLRPSAQKIYLQQPSYLNTNFHLPPSETHGFTKQPLDISNLQNQMFPFQSISRTAVPQQLDRTESEHQRSEPQNEFPSSSSTPLKRWRGQNDNLVIFEEGNGNTQNAVVSSRSDGDQLPGNEDSWICPSD